MMRPKYVKRRMHIPFVRELRLLVGSLTVLFAALSLLTYHVHDSSWLYASTESVDIQNKGGAVGAAVAALFLYCFGGAASFIVLGTLFFMLYCALARRPWSAEWDRVGAGFLLAVVVAALCSVHAIDVWGSVYTGGLVGHGVHAVVYYFFDALVGTIFLYTLLAVCVVLLFRISWIMLAKLVVRTMRFVVRACVSKERVWAPAYRLSKKVAHRIAYPFVHVARFAHHVCRGSAMPEEYYSVADFEQLLEHDILEENRVFDFTGVSTEKQLMVDAQQGESMEFDATENFAQAHNAANSVCVQGQEQITRRKEYQCPSVDVFIGVVQERHDKQMRQELETRARLLEEKLERFGVQGKVTAIKYGPVVTLFEYQPDIDTKLSKILALEDDLALALEAVSIRILAPIPGRAVVGFEVANQRRLDVSLAGIIRSKQYKEYAGVLPLILGEDTIGQQVIVDLSKMPHLLIAGSTGSGKSVALNVMLMSLLCRLSPDDLNLILIDPKRLEFATYADIAHLLFPVITDAVQATVALRWVVQEMEARYTKMAACGVRTIADYRAVQTADPMPYIVVVIDELADLMMTAGRDCQDLITRITQMARAAGIHLIVATQRPSVDVITGLIKANFPSRISFRVASKTDSRTILDCNGADKLLGRGDMLFLDAASAILRRVHGAYVSDGELATVTAHIRAERPAKYRDLIAAAAYDEKEALSESDDALYAQVREFLTEIDEVSISLLQRKFRIGYNRSARIIDRLQVHGLVMPADGGKTRKVIH